MKAVVYHADAKIAEKFPKDTYKNLLLGLRKNCNKFNIPLIHITIDGFTGYGDENIFVDADPEDIVWNREKFFIEFLKSADPNEVFYFTEPDSRINKMFPPLQGDLALLHRKTRPRVTPAWRLAKQSAVSIFEEAFAYYNVESKDWITDCVGWDRMYETLGEPKTNSTITYNNVQIEFRDYKQYCMKRTTGFVSQFKSHHKQELVDRNNEF